MNTETINSAIKNTGVITLMDSGSEGASHALGIKHSLSMILNGGDLDEDFFSDLNKSANTLQEIYNDTDSVEGIAAQNILATVKECSDQFYAEIQAKEEDTANVTIEDIGGEIVSIQDALTFSVNRLRSGRVDDPAINPIETVLKSQMPKLGEIINSFINKNADEYDAVVEKLEDVNSRFLARGLLVEQLNKDKSGFEIRIKSLINELSISNDVATGLRATVRETTKELKELNALNPQRMKKSLGESKIERARLTAENKKLNKNVTEANMAINFLRGQYARLDAKYSLLTETHHDIATSMKLLTGQTLEGNIAYQRSDESPDYAWIHVCYMQRFMSDEMKAYPVGKRIVNFPHFYLEVKTSYGVNVSIMLSEWGYLSYQIIQGMTDWFGGNLVRAAQAVFDSCIEENHPELWKRFVYLRSILLTNIAGMNPKTVVALADVGITNAGQVGSNTPERLKALSGITLTEAKKALSLCQEFFDGWVSEHGELDVYSSRGADIEANIDAMQQKALADAVKKLDTEVPELLNRISMSLADKFTESESANEAAIRS